MAEIGEKHKVLIIQSGIKIGDKFYLDNYEWQLIPRPKFEGEMNYAWAKIVARTDKPDSGNVIIYFE